MSEAEERLARLESQLSDLAEAQESRAERRPLTLSRPAIFYNDSIVVKVFEVNE